MKKFLALALSALTLAFGALFFAACSPDDPDPGKDPDTDGSGTGTAEEAVADVYAPDGAPALALAQLMSEEMQFGGEVTYNVVAASTIQTYVTGEDPQAELCILPVNAAAQALGKGDDYKMLGTVTHGNIFVLSAASNNFETLTADNLGEQLLGKTVGCIQLQQVVGLTLRIVLENNNIPYEIVEDVSQATEDDVVYLLNISDPATMIVPTAEYDYMVAAEPVVSAKVTGTQGKLEVVGDLQALYGGENGWPQAVLVGKTSFVEECPNFVESFCEALVDNAAWLADEDTAASTVIDAVAAHLPDGATPTFSEKNLTKEVIANCAIRFEYAADCKAEVNAFLDVLSDVAGKDFTVNDSFYYDRAAELTAA